MREHERNTLNQKYRKALLLSLYSKTVFYNDEILCCYGMMDDGGMWQVPSRKIQENMMMYARGAKKVIQEMIKGKYCYSLCLNDQLHDRWMRFIGFKPTEEFRTIGNHDYVIYEVNNGN